MASLTIRDISLHDMHLHIQKGQSVSNYIQTAQSLGTEVLGITEHIWDISHIPTSSPYYQDKTLERILMMRSSAPHPPQNLKLLWGGETEYAAVPAQVGILSEQSKSLDYVVVPHSHFFLPGFTFPADMNQPEELADYMVKTFREVTELSVTTVIAHPFDPTAVSFQQEDFLSAVFAHLSPSVLEDCFSLAAQRGKIIEINLGSFVLGLKQPLYQKTYFPMFAIAKRAGCRFCLASDAQRPEHLSRLSPENARYVIEALDLHREDILIPGVDTLCFDG